MMDTALMQDRAEGTEGADRYRNRLEALAGVLSAKGIDAWLIPMGDYHGSEYISPFFQLIAYYTGFTGSAATLLVVPDGGRARAFLWTDGRYFLQAEKELSGTGVILEKMGEKGCITLTERLQKLADANNSEGRTFVLGFDGRVVSIRQAEEIRNSLKDMDTGLITDCDLAGELWDRPPLTFGPIWELADAYSGESRSSKMNRVRESMQKEGAGALVLTALDEIAWLLNLRGEDIAYNPVCLSYLIILQDEAVLFTDADNLSQIEGCVIKPYDDFFGQLSRIDPSLTVWIDQGSASWRVLETLQSGSEREILQKPSPVIMMKAIKNETEREHIRRAHIKDGVAVTRWIYTLKKRSRSKSPDKAEKSELSESSELSEAERLLSLRREQEGFLSESFAPIIAFGPHGAIVHYEPDDESDATIRYGRGDYLLADTGGHYREGTTDITRTISLGMPDDEQKKLYTAVLAGHLRLLDACFLEGAAGSSLDQLARQPLYRLGYDYRHGTGHGVGYLLNVHEGPNAFRMKYTKENRLYEGMVTSDEPGVYLANRFGIRIEGLVLTVFSHESEYGRFLRFEPLTMVPFDRDSIDADLLNDEDKRVLNAYQKKICETISPFLSEEEHSWLEEETRPV